MKPVQDMTLDECRDEIAVAMGWVRDRPSVCATGSWRGPDNAWMHGLDHPVPATLDSIAASLPPGVKWEKFVWPGGVASAYAHGAQRFIADSDEFVKVEPTDAMILAMARCCVAAWRKYKENAQ
jgi:hypothetical protein